MDCRLRVFRDRSLVFTRLKSCLHLSRTLKDGDQCAEDINPCDLPTEVPGVEPLTASNQGAGALAEPVASQPVEQMKNRLVYYLVSISWILILIESAVVPPNNIQKAEKAKEALPGKENTNNEAAVNPERHNTDLTKADKLPVQEAETVEMTPLANTRQLVYNDYVSLKWVDWAGSVPSGAVSINNQYAGRTDYVCSVQTCALGYYSPSKGSYCRYTNAGREYSTSAFKILVNEQNFEVIQWLPGSYGSVPSNPVSRCSGTFVGKNQYGLGMVIPSSRVLSIPFNGYEYTYDYYEVLNLYTNYNTQTLTGVSYSSSQASYFRENTQVLSSIKVTNNVCQALSKTVVLSKTVLADKYWDIGRPTNPHVKTTITASIPSISRTSISLPSSQEFNWEEGTPLSQSLSYSLGLAVHVNPFFECEVVLQGTNIHTSMPFSSTLTRTYQNGERRSMTINGIFTNVQMDEVTISLGKCNRIPNAPPC
ncbi:natterin-4-like [Hyperolius riggenbachi]|uniref:natterin-4-like n=1 Tax=Hyperolius riggenbachi TaxID=752182 RepID=UPI0035A3972C